MSAAGVSGCRGAVAAGHPVTAAAAVEILEEGGNAFDAVAAALATSFVVEPALSSPGGGGFLLAHATGREPRVLDFFAQTPGRCPDSAQPGADTAAEPLDFLPLEVDFGVATQEFHVGRAAAAVPGMIPGLCAMVEALGTLPLDRVLEPAIRCARRGEALAPMQAHIIAVIGPILTLTAEARAVFGDPAQDSQTLPEGAILRLPDLADTLELLAREGERAFRDGPIGSAMANLCREGGLLREDDLNRYRVAWRAPLHRRVFGSDVYTNPPPSAGGPLLLFGLLLADTLGHAPTAGELAEIMGITAAARDAAGLDHAIDRHHVEALFADASLAHWQRQFESGRRALKRHGTTHMSVIDTSGNAAACTVSNGEGCGYMVPGTGFMLNNMLGEEDLNPNGFFRWQPDTRVASMMSPTLAERGDGRLLALGSAGSNRIRTALLQVLCNTLARDMPIAEAINAPRLHVERRHLDVEGGWPTQDTRALRKLWREHRIWDQRSMFFGGVQAVQRLADGSLEAAGDPRRGGAAAWAR
jgi:gamma-glutamyltranspeptidase/glutathione hydrolase